MSEMANVSLAPAIKSELEEGRGQLTFIPWLMLSKEVIVQNIAFVPVSTKNVRRVIPGEAGKTIYSLIRRHRDARGHRLRGLTVLLHRCDNGWTWRTQDHSSADVNCKMLALACLARQSFFENDLTYINGAMFAPIVQGLNPGSLEVALVVQRRTGRQWDGGWQFNEVTFQAAPTIPIGGSWEPDFDLLSALNVARAADSCTWKRIEAALPFFLLGVSELQELTSHASAMLLALAFERLLNPKESKAHLLAEAFHHVWSRYSRIKLGHTGLKADKDKYAFDQPNAPVHRKWVKELYEVRNSFVHHREADGRTSNWSTFQHVIAASFAFPLTVKLLLAGEGHYMLSDNDDCCCGAFDRLLTEGLETRDRFKGPKWSLVLAEERMARAALRDG